MTDNFKTALNSSVVEFVNQELDRRADDPSVTVAEIANAYVRAHFSLIWRTGIARDQLFRMIEYTMEIGYPQDAFLCCEFGPAIEESAARLAEDIGSVAPDGPIFKLRLPDLLRMGRGLELRLEEREAMLDRQNRIDALLLPFCRSLRPEPNAEKFAFEECVRMLVQCYDGAVSQHLPREHWMEEFQFLTLPVRLIEPGLSSFEAFMKVVPKRIAVPTFKQ